MDQEIDKAIYERKYELTNQLILSCYVENDKDATFINFKKAYINFRIETDSAFEILAITKAYDFLKLLSFEEIGYIYKGLINSEE